MNTSKISNALLWGIMTMLWILSLNTVSQADDFYYFRPETCKELFFSLGASILCWNPRIGETFTWLYTFPFHSGLIYRLFNPIIFLIIGYSVASIATDHRKTSSSSFRIYVSHAILLLFLFGGSRAYNQFWMSGGSNWLWPMAAITYAVSLIIRNIRGESLTRWQYFLLAFCSAIAGASTETQIISMGGILALLTITYARDCNKKAFFVAIASFFAAATIFWCIYIFSVGLSTRYSGFGHDTFQHLTLIQKYLQPVPWNFLLHDLLPPFLLAIVSAASLFACTQGNCSIISIVKRYRYPLLLGAASLVCALIPLPLSKGWMADRTLLLPSVILITGCLWVFSACTRYLPRYANGITAILSLLAVLAFWGSYSDMKYQQEWWRQLQRITEELNHAEIPTEAVTLPGMYQFMKRDIRFPGADFVCYSRTAYRLPTRTREFRDPNSSFNKTMKKYLGAKFDISFAPIPKDCEKWGTWDISSTVNK